MVIRVDNANVTRLFKVYSCDLSSNTLGTHHLPSCIWQRRLLKLINSQSTLFLSPFCKAPRLMIYLNDIMESMNDVSLSLEKNVVRIKSQRTTYLPKQTMSQDAAIAIIFAFQSNHRAYSLVGCFFFFGLILLFVLASNFLLHIIIEFNFKSMWQLLLQSPWREVILKNKPHHFSQPNPSLMENSSDY